MHCNQTRTCYFGCKLNSRHFLAQDILNFCDKYIFTSSNSNEFCSAESPGVECLFGETHGQTKHWISLVERRTHCSSAKSRQHSRITICRCPTGTVSSSLRFCLSCSRRRCTICTLPRLHSYVTKNNRPPSTAWS